MSPNNRFHSSFRYPDRGRRRWGKCSVPYIEMQEMVRVQRHCAFIICLTRLPWATTSSQRGKVRGIMSGRHLPRHRHGTGVEEASVTSVQLNHMATRNRNGGQEV